MRYLPITFVAAGLAGCIGSSGILPGGHPDTYTVTEMVAPINGGGAAARNIALTEAADFCRDQGRVFVLGETSPAGDLRYPPTGSRLTFQCLGSYPLRAPPPRP